MRYPVWPAAEAPEVVEVRHERIEDIGEPITDEEAQLIRSQ